MASSIQPNAHLQIKNQLLSKADIKSRGLRQQYRLLKSPTVILTFCALWKDFFFVHLIALKAAKNQ